MAKFHCKNCDKDFEMNYFKWLFTTLFHWFSFKHGRDYRLTKCPHCSKKSWMRREK